MATAGFIRATRSKQALEVQATRSEAISGFLRDMLSSVDPEKAQGREVTVREALEEGAERVGQSFADQPAVRAAVRDTIGKTYESLGWYEEAESLYRRALAIRENTHGAEHPQVAVVINNLAVLCSSQGNRDEAKKLYRQALSIYEKTCGGDHPNAVACRENLEAVLEKEKGVVG